MIVREKTCNIFMNYYNFYCLTGLMNFITGKIVKLQEDVTEILRRSSPLGPDIAVCDFPSLPVDTIEEFQSLNDWLSKEKNKLGLVRLNTNILV
jgi:hypothetical protein